jgi:putative ABC transport system substrate-binding protein
LIVPDPVAARLVNSLASPGSNITGLSSISTDLSAKRLQMFKQAISGLARLGLMVNPRDKLVSARTLSEMQAAGAELKLDIVPVEAQEASDMETAIERASRTRIDGLVVAQDPVFFAARHQIAQLALAHRLPSNCFNSDMVAAGFLMSYGVNSPAMFRRTPRFVDRILKGVKPQDIPVEQPTLFEATFNLRTARALGLKLPQSVLLQAQHLFE